MYHAAYPIGLTVGLTGIACQANHLGGKPQEPPLGVEKVKIRREQKRYEFTNQDTSKTQSLAFMAIVF